MTIAAISHMFEVPLRNNSPIKVSQVFLRFQYAREWKEPMASCTQVVLYYTSVQGHVPYILVQTVLLMWVGTQTQLLFPNMTSMWVQMCSGVTWWCKTWFQTPPPPLVFATCVWGLHWQLQQIARAVQLECYAGSHTRKWIYLTTF